MANKSLNHKVLLVVALCGANQLSIAQRTPSEPPLTPVQSQVQLPLSIAEILSKNTVSAKSTPPPATVTWVATVRPQPLFLLNSEVIIAPDFSGIQPANIEKVMVYKGSDAPAQWRELVTYGIIDITPKQKTKVRSRTLAAVGKEFNLSGPVRYTVNAMPVTDAGLRIALDAIGEIKITRATPETPTATVAISVRPPKPGPPDPPGTIRIRGVAAH